MSPANVAAGSVVPAVISFLRNFPGPGTPNIVQVDWIQDYPFVRTILELNLEYDAVWRELIAGTSLPSAASGWGLITVVLNWTRTRRERGKGAAGSVQCLMRSDKRKEMNAQRNKDRSDRNEIVCSCP